MDDLAGRSGTTASYLAKVEAGTMQPPWPWVQHVGRQLGLIVGEIADGAYSGHLEQLTESVGGDVGGRVLKAI